MRAHHAWQANVAKARATFKARLAEQSEADPAAWHNYIVGLIQLLKELDV